MLVLAAALADAAGAHGLAFYALLLAIPAAALVALSALAEVIDGDGDGLARLEAVLATVGLTLVVLGAATRSGALGDEAVPPLGAVALVACLLALGLQTVFAGLSLLRRR